MLQDGDINRLLDAFNESAHCTSSAAHPSTILASQDGLYPQELFRLCSSIQIAAIMGDAPRDSADAVRLLHRECVGIRFLPLTSRGAWIEALAWARAQLAEQLAEPRRFASASERDTIVGSACLRLRKRGCKIEIGAYGPKIADSSRQEIIKKADSFIQVIGGIETASQILRYLSDANCYHDEMWLFGETGLNLYDKKSPMVPVGWLYSLALRHLNRPGRARKPEVAWKSLIELATDFAAAHDCQRYSQFEDIDVHASQMHRVVQDSTHWREFFSLPQVPPRTLRPILTALAAVMDVNDNAKLGFSLRQLIDEITRLLNCSATDRLITHVREGAEQDFPLLWRITGGVAKSVNADYLDPLSARGRTQDAVLLFAQGANKVVTMPRAYLSAAACEFVFRLIWKKLDAKRAAEIVGNALERAIWEGCRGKDTLVLFNEKYKVSKICYEFDVATRNEDRIVMIETKGKSITWQSRSGDLFSFLDDYSKSFLHIVSQLVRHEINLRKGVTPLTTANETVEDFRPLKVAVSPLSYGPVSDKLLSNSVLRSLSGIKLTLVEPGRDNQAIVDAFNKRLESLFADLIEVAPKKDGKADLFPYLKDVFWLDLGQILYVLDRASTVWDAFQPLYQITRATRDFWTELAHADRAGQTRGYWRPVSTS